MIGSILVDNSWLVFTACWHAARDAYPIVAIEIPGRMNTEERVPRLPSSLDQAITSENDSGYSSEPRKNDLYLRWVAGRQGRRVFLVGFWHVRDLVPHARKWANYAARAYRCLV